MGPPLYICLSGPHSSVVMYVVTCVCVVCGSVHNEL